MRGGIGIVGVSLENLGNPLATFAAPPPPLAARADGFGTGVMGASGSGTGVLGASQSSDGVRGESEQGDAVVGRSTAGRGARFESGRTASGSIVGQVCLVPQFMPGSGLRTATPTAYDFGVVQFLPRDGSGGDLLATRADDGTCALWFCTRDSQEGQPAKWCQVLLSDPASAAPPEFTDWISADPTSATGTLHGHEVRLTGPIGTGSDFNATFTLFDSDAFTPRLAASDCVEIVGGAGHTFTLAFGSPVQDPVLLLASFGSIMTFAPGTVVRRLSGDAGFTVTGNLVTGVAGQTDSNGTVRLTGVFTTIGFTVTTNLPDTAIPDGIFLQVGGSTA